MDDGGGKNETSTAFVYKIIPASSFLGVPISPSFLLPASSLDQQSGFIHLSTAAQIPGTLQRFFASPATSKHVVYLLRVSYEPLEQKDIVKWESPDAQTRGARGDEGMFPHVYKKGGDLTISGSEVESVEEVESMEGIDGWEDALEVLKDEQWLR